MTPPYTVDYFIQKFEAIPDEKWTTGFYQLGDKYCVLGHCGVWVDRADRFRIFFTEEGDALDELIPCYNIGSINDGLHPSYPQPTPKARILAALRDIQKKQEKT